MHPSFLTFFVGKREVPEVQRGSKQVGKNKGSDGRWMI
jgi:hypothetical protein